LFSVKKGFQSSQHDLEWNTSSPLSDGGQHEANLQLEWTLMIAHQLTAVSTTQG